jgi:hypothetical protein
MRIMRLKKAIEQFAIETEIIEGHPMYSHGNRMMCFYNNKWFCWMKNGELPEAIFKSEDSAVKWLLEDENE